MLANALAGTGLYGFELAACVLFRWFLRLKGFFTERTVGEVFDIVESSAVLVLDLT